MVYRNWLHWALLPTLFCLSACKDLPWSDPAAEDTPSTASSEASVTDRLAEVRSEIIARNFGRAAELARALVDAFPQHPDASFELARAEALAGNQGYAMDALEQAVTKGLANAPAALKDAAFQSIRNSDRFRALARKANPSTTAIQTPERETDRAPDRPRPTVAAGHGSAGVEIYESNGGTRIRAGDVVLETDF